MSKRHHRMPVGMLAVGGRSFGALEHDFATIYSGEPDEVSPYQACNRIQSYGDGNLWGIGNPEGPNRIAVNVAAWIEFLRRVRTANERVGGGNLQAILSRNLMGLHIERRWPLSQLGDYVARLCREIVREGLEDLVAGWWLDDEGVEKTSHTTARWEAVLDTVHTAQKANGCNFPFYWAEELDSPPYWERTLFGGWRHRIAPKLREWVAAFVSPDFPNRHDATPILMPFYYPWAANHWRYGRLPPFEKWRLFLANLNAAFPAREHPRLEFHPILELSQQRAGVAPPGHVDVHRQIRAVLELPRVSGIWFLGWNQSGEPNGFARRNWTGKDSPRWAEAIQSEVGTATEALRAAVPNETRLLRSEPEPFSDGTRLLFQLAKRARVRFEIWEGGSVVRTLDEGVLPPGVYDRDGIDPGDPLHGTSAYWDGRDDRGRDLPRGRYACLMRVDDDYATRRVLTKR